MIATSATDEAPEEPEDQPALDAECPKCGGPMMDGKCPSCDETCSECGGAMSEGHYKVFRTCVGWLAEFRTYQRDEKGRVVKRNDHHMDETRYFVMSGVDLARAPIPPKPKADPLLTYSPSAGGWMG